MSNSPQIQRANECSSRFEDAESAKHTEAADDVSRSVEVVVVVGGFVGDVKVDAATATLESVGSIVAERLGALTNKAPVR